MMRLPKKRPLRAALVAVMRGAGPRTIWKNRHDHLPLRIQKWVNLSRAAQPKKHKTFPRKTRRFLGLFQGIPF